MLQLPAGTAERRGAQTTPSTRKRSGSHTNVAIRSMFQDPLEHSGNSIGEIPAVTGSRRDSG